MLDFADFVNYFFLFPFKTEIVLQETEIALKVSELVKDLLALASRVKGFFFFC